MKTKVRFRVNLGSRDAVEFGVKHEDCTAGAEVMFDEKEAAVLVARGVAEAIDEPAPEKPAKEVKAVPAAPSVAKGKDAEIK